MKFNLSRTQVPLEQLVRASATFRSAWAWRSYSPLARSAAARACVGRTICCEASAFGKSRPASASLALETRGPGYGVAWRGTSLTWPQLQSPRTVVNLGRLGSSFAALLGVGLLDLYCAFQSVAEEPRARRESSQDYSKRSGFPRGIEQMRGAALKSGHYKAAPKVRLQAS